MGASSGSSSRGTGVPAGGAAATAAGGASLESVANQICWLSAASCSHMPPSEASEATWAGMPTCGMPELRRPSEAGLRARGRVRSGTVLVTEVQGGAVCGQAAALRSAAVVLCPF